LSAEFAACPIFLDWARQEAAGVRRPEGAAAGSRVLAADAAAASLAADEDAPPFLGTRYGVEPAAGTAANRRSTEANANLWSYEGETAHTSYPTSRPAPSSLAAPAVTMAAKRGPTHPGWENPPRVESYPRLRAREDQRTNQPLLYIAIGAAIIMVALLVIPILLNQHGSTSSTATGSPASAAPGSGGPGASASVSTPGTPGASASYLVYLVKANDNLSLIALKFNLKLWELLLANPQITDMNHIQVGDPLNIPPPGLLTQPPASASPGQ